ALSDPRQPGKVLYPLPEIMLLVLCATLAGAEDFVEIRMWGREKLEFLRSMLPFRRGIPSHDTLNDVMNALDPELFSACFTAWVEGLREDAPDIVAVDGKTSRRARRGEEHPLHVVSAWASRQRLVLGQQAIGTKSNEIVAIPLLLERLQLTGALVTIDAMGCQTKIAQAIRDRGADYLLALKDNQRSLADEVETFFAAPDARCGKPFETIDADHGRIETRRHWISHEVDWLTTDRRFPGEPRFPGLKAIAMVEATIERGGKTSTARRFFLSSLAMDAATLARAVRAHWGIENRLHWVLDVVFHDDLMRLRTEHGPKNMATIKHMAMNLVRAAPGKDSLKVRRKAAGWSQDYLRTLLTGTTQ
ncbi:MAG: ISAs1 family transposase, partial [Steroidobacteraceae bacterium]